MFFYILALATILESTRWVGFSRPMVQTSKQQAGRVPPLCDTVNMLFSPDFIILE